MAEQPPKIQKPDKPKLSNNNQLLDYKEPERRAMPDIAVASTEVPTISPFESGLEAGIQKPLPPANSIGFEQFTSNETEPFFRGAENGAEEGVEKDAIIKSITKELEELGVNLVKAISAREQERDGRAQGFNAALKAHNLERPLDKFDYDQELDEKVRRIRSRIEELKQDYKAAVNGLEIVVKSNREKELKSNRAKGLPQGPIKKMLNIWKSFPLEARSIFVGVSVSLITSSMMHPSITPKTPTHNLVPRGAEQITQVADPISNILNDVKAMDSDIAVSTSLSNQETSFTFRNGTQTQLSSETKEKIVKIVLNQTQEGGAFTRSESSNNGFTIRLNKGQWNKGLWALPKS